MTPRQGHAMNSRISKFLKVVSIAVVFLGGFVAYDLYYPRTTQLRQFDSDEVARLETAMWRSYYDKERFKLFRELSELMRTQYKMPLVRSNLVAYYAANAAIVFQKGKQRSDYEKALPDLVKFYQAIRQMSDIPFDVNQVAKLELEWWIIHRQRDSHAPGDLTKSLAELQAAIYGMPVDRFMEHGRLRAEAMTIRDTKAEQGGVTEADWMKIDQLLHQSWRSLLDTVNSPQK
jgi:hypothetical protein